MERAAQTIRALRMVRDLTQKQVAAACRLRTALYNSIETGRINPSPLEAERIARAFNISADEFLKILTAQGNRLWASPVSRKEP